MARATVSPPTPESKIPIGASVTSIKPSRVRPPATLDTAICPERPNVRGAEYSRNYTRHMGQANQAEPAPETSLAPSEEMIVMNDRVVITGLGALTPLGNSWTETWDGLTSGRSGVARITQFDATDLPTQIAGEVKGFDPATQMSIKQVKRASRASQMSIAAA